MKTRPLACREEFVLRRVRLRRREMNPPLLLPLWFRITPMARPSSHGRPNHHPSESCALGSSCILVRSSSEPLSISGSKVRVPDGWGQTGFLDPGMVGLTLGYSVFICHSHETARLLSHEFRYVYQYERVGSIAAFLPEYLLQIVERGYTSTTFELDALAHERTDV